MNRGASERSDSGSRHVPILELGTIPASTGAKARYRINRREDLAGNEAAAGAIRAIAAQGHDAIDTALLSRFPNLEIVANFGVGVDQIDIGAATAAGIVVTNTPDVLTDEVADLAIGLLIATVRRIPDAERHIRSGAWSSGDRYPLTTSLRQRRVGIVGMGRIGAAVARRCIAMGLDVAYHSRTRKPDAVGAYYDRLADLARDVSILIVTVPGGDATRHLIDADILDALGPAGTLVNVARGSVVDEAALVEALRSRRIADAGLDVFADEPHVPSGLMDCDNVVLLPHVGSATTTTRQAMGDLTYANLDSWFAGKGPITPVNQL